MKQPSPVILMDAFSAFSCLLAKLRPIAICSQKCQNGRHGNFL
jgi:hypothetical protein